MDEADRLGQRLGAYGDDELRRWALLGSTPRPFAGALHDASRACFLRLAIGASHGDDVARGLDRTDVEAALRLGSTPAIDPADLDAKRLALREHVDSSSGLVGAMLRAALEHDCRRLGPARADVASVGRAGRAPSAARAPGRLGSRREARARDDAD